MAKIIDQIKKYEEEKKVWYSFEYFPPKTPKLVESLYGRLAKMSSYKPPPLFLDVTWGAGGRTSDLTISICTKIQQEYGNANMHLTCTNMPVEKITQGLEEAKKAGIRNIVALRGDPPEGQERWQAVDGGFSYAVDLVRYIRERHGDYFCISVAGYPEAHPEAPSLEEDIQTLKGKVDAGADFIITQLFYDVDLFLEWVAKVRAAGITVPIIPGIMPIQSYDGFKRMTGFCKTKIPQDIHDSLESVKDNANAVEEYGVKLGIEMCKKILAAGVCPGLHFYTLNKEKTTRAIIEGLGLVTPLPAPAESKEAKDAKQSKEDAKGRPPSPAAPKPAVAPSSAPSSECSSCSSMVLPALLAALAAFALYRYFR